MNTSNFFQVDECQVVTIRDVNHLILYACAYSFIEAGVIVTIQVQLLTSDSIHHHNYRTLHSFGVILELLGILLAICFVQSYHPDEDHPRRLHQR